jgi:hypothetical protein
MQLAELAAATMVSCCLIDKFSPLKLSSCKAGWLFQAQGEGTAGPLGILLDLMRPYIVKRGKTR